MKINIISIFFPPEKGAASGRIFNMAKELKARGCDVEVITAMPNYPTGKIFDGYSGLLKKEDVDGIKVRRHWLYPSNSKNPILRVWSMVSFSFSMYMSFFHLRRRKADITIINSPPLFTGIAGVFLGKMVSGKVVTNISDIWPLSALELGVIKRGRFYSVLEWIEKKIYQKSDLCVSQSEETQEHIKKVVPNVDTFVYRNIAKLNVEGANAKNSSKRSDNFRIVYAGLLGVAQGILKIVQQVDFEAIGAELHIYGAGHEAKAIEEYIAKNSGANVYYHGLKKPSEITELLPEYSASLIPLVNPIYGAFPSKIFTAMAAGIPILFSGEGEGARFVKQYQIGYVNSSSELGNLEANIKRMKELPSEKYKVFGETAKDLMNSEFAYSRNHDRLYKKLVEVEKS